MGIYAGLWMVEKNCIEIDHQQCRSASKLTCEQLLALVALHRTLLLEQQDFLLSSQHQSNFAALRELATRYEMPARMWKHGIHGFLELLRRRLPDSLGHMQAFVHLASSMVALQREMEPAFEETWLECLGDLAHYRMEIEEAESIMQPLRRPLMDEDGFSRHTSGHRQLPPDFPMRGLI